MEGTNFSLEGLDSLIETLEAEKIELNSSDKMKNFETIINGVAKKYFGYGKEGNKYMSEKEARQEFWVKALEVIQDCGGKENVDESLIAKVIYNRAVDLFRYHKRRYSTKAQFIEGSEQELDDDAPDYFEALYSDKFIKGYELVLIKEVIDLFEIGSKERKYAVLKIVNSGLIQKSDLDPWDQAIVDIPETDDEEGYIHLLGYTSHCPGSWTKKKREMRRIVLEFLES